MVVVLELDDDEAFDPYARPKGLLGLQQPLQLQQKSVIIRDDGDRKEWTDDTGRLNPNINGFSAALGCYPWDSTTRTRGEDTNLDIGAGLLPN